MKNSRDSSQTKAKLRSSGSPLMGLVMRKFYTKVEALNQIGYLEAQKPNKGYRFKFSLFFMPDNDRIYLLDRGLLVLFTTNCGLIDLGNLECITDEYEELSFREFNNVITIDA